MFAVTFVSGSSDALQVGAAKELIAFETESPLAGHAYRRGRDAHRQEGEFYARSLYLEDEGFRAVLVSIDLYAITTELRTRILSNLPDGIDPKHVILTATHTHSGPGGLAQSWFHRQIYGRYMDANIETIALATSTSIQAALDSKRRATIGYEIGEVKSLSRPAYSSGGTYDTDLGVIRIDDSDGNSIAILGSFSAAPATLRRNNGLVVSPDYPGVFTKELESMGSEGMIAFFLSAASGDQVCKMVDDKEGLEWHEHIGKELALQVKAIANKIKCQEFPLQFYTYSHSIPEGLQLDNLPEQIPFHAIGISRLLVNFVPGVPTADFKNALIKEIRQGDYRSHIIVGLSNDNLMTLSAPTASDKAEYGPIHGTSILGDQALPWCVDAINALIDSPVTTSGLSDE